MLLNITCFKYYAVYVYLLGYVVTLKTLDIVYLLSKEDV